MEFYSRFIVIVIASFIVVFAPGMFLKIEKNRMAQEKSIAVVTENIMSICNEEDLKNEADWKSGFVYVE